MKAATALAAAGVDEVVRHPTARGWRLRVDPVTGAARLTVPRRGALGPALAWAAGQGAWVAEARAKLPPGRPFVPGATLPYGGRDLLIDARADALRTPVLDGARLVVGGPVEAVPRRVQAWLRARALALLTEDTQRFAALAGVKVERVAVGDPRARWGSCSATGAVRYSWRLVCAPPFVREHVAAHEVAHRLHLNHGPEFHAVARSLHGDPAPARAWLRENGAMLHRLGRV